MASPGVKHDRPLVPPGGLSAFPAPTSAAIIGVAFAVGTVCAATCARIRTHTHVMDPTTNTAQQFGISSVMLTQRDRDLLVALITHQRRCDAAASLGYSDRHLRRLIGSLLSRLELPTTHAAVAVAVASGALGPTHGAASEVGALEGRRD